MITKDAVNVQIDRLKVIWPLLNSRPENVKEIGKAIWRYRDRLIVEDLIAGVDLLLERTPSTSWMPGPSEVLGCILMQAKNRDRPESAEVRGSSLMPVDGLHCQRGRCHGTLEFAVLSSALYCATCRSVQVRAEVEGVPRYALTDAEISGLKFSESRQPDESDVIRGIDSARKMISALKDAQEKGNKPVTLGEVVFTGANW